MSVVSRVSVVSTGRVSEITKLWEKPDGVAVFSVACQSKVNSALLDWWVKILMYQQNLTVVILLVSSWWSVGGVQQVQLASGSVSR